MVDKVGVDGLLFSAATPAGKLIIVRYTARRGVAVLERSENPSFPSPWGFISGFRQSSL